MTDCIIGRRALRSALLIACLAGSGTAASGDQTHPDYAGALATRRVPDNLRVPARNREVFAAHAEGTQNYICLPSGSGFAWSLFTPQATLFNRRDQQTLTHFFSPNPAEPGTVRPAWQDSRDTSRVWGRGIASSADPSFVAPGAIPWLLIQVVGTEEGATWGDALTGTTFIQRVNTQGGAAPSTGCSQSTDLGGQVYVPYAADYVFYESSTRRRHHW